MTENDLPAHDTSRAVLGGFFYVYSQLGPGFLESVYHRALGNTLERSGCLVEREAVREVRFEGAVVGAFRADLIVDGRVIVEVKAVDQLTNAHDAQVINYLRASGLPVGLLLNFGPRAAFRRLVGPTARNVRPRTPLA
jgi:GxxExxY protein